GGWKGDAQNAFNPQTQTAEQKEFFDFTQKLLNWRKGKTVIHTGKTTHYMPKDGVYVYFRDNDNEKVMVVINKNEKDQSFDLKRFAQSINGVTAGTDIISAKQVQVSTENKLTVSGKSSVILELKYYCLT